MGINGWRDSFKCTVENDRNTYLRSMDTRKVKVLPVLLNHFLISRGIFEFYISTVVYALQAAFIVVMLNASTTNRNGFESLLKLNREADIVKI